MKLEKELMMVEESYERRAVLSWENWFFIYTRSPSSLLVKK